MNDDLRLQISTCVKNATAGDGTKSYRGSNTRDLRGWTRIRVTAGIERFPRDFEISYSEAFPNSSDVVVQEGDVCQVFLGNDLVISGFIDKRLQRISAREHTLAVSGRGACSDLLDCAAYWPGSQFVGQNILYITKQLASIYGIPVNLDVNANVGASIAQVVIIAGETVYSIVERLARFRALLLLEQPDGSVLLSAVGTVPMASGFQEGINVLEATTVFGMDGRYSDYFAVQQGLDVFKDIGNGGNEIAHITDPGVPRLRYRMIVAEPVINGQDVAAQRATWEMARRYGRSFQVKVVTDSWRDSSGELWKPNRLVSINLPSLKIVNKTWLIAEVSYLFDDAGTKCELTIMPPQGFSPEPLILNPVAPDIAKTV